MLTIKKVEFKGKEFIKPYLNNEKEIEFTYLGLPQATFVLNDGAKSLELRYNKETLGVIPLKAHFKEFVAMKREIWNDIVAYNKRLAEDTEPIILFYLKGEDNPFYVTTQSILDNGEHSAKYIGGLVYNANLKLKAIGKRPFKDISDMQIRLNKALSSLDLKTLQQCVYGNEVVYKTTLGIIMGLI